MALKEAAAIRLHRAGSWLTKARRAAKHQDLDSQFIFLWIAFNALYGTPRYRRELPSDEITDFTSFLDRIETLSPGCLSSSLAGLEPSVRCVVESPFLTIECWRAWDRAGIRDREKRVATSRQVRKSLHGLTRVFRQLYTLRNQLLHGAATDAGRRNRDSLRHGTAILDASVPVLIEVVEAHHAKIPSLEPVPYLPSVGEGGRFNTLRVTRRVALPASNHGIQPTAFGRG